MSSIMIRLLDLKKRQAVSLPDNEALMNLRLDGGNYLPVTGDDYYIETMDGTINKLDGSQVLKFLDDNSNSKLLSPEEASVKIAVQGEYSATGQALKALGSEAMLLGLNRGKPVSDDPISQMVEAERQKRFGVAETAGGIAGMLGPLALGGVGALISQGAKTGAKAYLKKAGAVAGKLPSAQVFALAGKAGQKVTQKTGSKLAGTIAGGGAFAGIEAGIQGTKKVVQEVREQGTAEERQTFGRILGEGAVKAGETFATASIAMGAFGVAGKVLGWTGSIGQKAVGKPTEWFKRSMDKFYGVEPGARGRRQIERLSTWFGGKKASNETKLKNFEKFLFKPGTLKGTDKIRNKKRLLEAVEESKDIAGKEVGDLRKNIVELFDYPDFDPLGKNRAFFINAFINKLQVLKKDLSPIQRNGLYRPYYNDLTRMQATLNKALKDKEVSLGFINDMMKFFARKGKYAKRERAELEIDKAYRKAYTTLSNAEDDFYSALEKTKTKFKQEAQKTFRGLDPLTQRDRHILNLMKIDHSLLKDTKDHYSKLVTAKEVLDDAIPTGTNFLFDFHTIGTRDTLLGLVGYSVGGFPGAVAGGLASRKWAGLQQEGWTYLALTKRIRGYMQENKTISGVQNLLSKTANRDLSGFSKLNLSQVSTFVTGRTASRLIDMDDVVSKVPVYELKGQEKETEDVAKHGGRDSLTRFVAKTAQMKRDIIALMPTYTYDIQGNKTYNEGDKDKFLKVVSQGITPMGFVESIVNQDLTEKGYSLFAKHYPDWLTNFNINFRQAFKAGKIDDNFYWLFLRSRDSTVKDFIYSKLDSDLEEEARPPERKMRHTEPRGIDIAQGGGYPS